MKLISESGYNPFFIDVGNKRYELNNILIYDKDGIICATNKGWFGCGDRRIKDLELPTNCIVKRKEDFMLNCAFLVKSPVNPYNDSKSWYSGLPYYSLYIPAAVIGLKEPTAKRYNIDLRHFEITFETAFEGVYIYFWHFVDEELQPFNDRLSKIGDNLKCLYKPTPVLLQATMSELQEIQAEYNKAYKKMLAITAEDVLKNYRK